LFGNECSFYQINPTADMPSDAQRIQKIMQLIEEKRSDRILVAHDIHTKHRLVSAACMVSLPSILLQDF
jgi:phosphotriesterase-related protein